MDAKQAHGNCVEKNILKKYASISYVLKWNVICQYSIKENKTILNGLKLGKNKII